MTTNAIRITTAATIIAAILAVALADLTISYISVGKIVAITISMYGLAIFYEIWRPRPKISRLIEGIALLVAFSAAGAALSYAGTAAAMPLQDQFFASLDRAIGFDWIAFLEFSTSSQLLSYVLIGAYHSSAFQLLGLLIGLALSGRLLLLDRFLLAYMLSALATIGIATVAPALGAYIYHAPDHAIMGMTAEAGIWHLPDFEALRTGTFGVLHLAEAEGLVTFPSFHTALAVLTIWAAWTWPLVRWPALVLNGLVIVATLPEGGHYLVDLFAGGTIALIAIAIASTIPERKAIPVTTRTLALR